MEGLYCEREDPQDHHQYNTWDMLQSPIIWLILDEFYFFSNITKEYRAAPDKKENNKTFLCWRKKDYPYI